MNTITSFFKRHLFTSLTLAIVAALAISMAAQALVGDLDPTFGSGGKIVSSGNPTNSIAIPSDGRIASTDLLTVTAPAFISQGANDGWILESTPTSNVGGIQNSNATTFNVGDDPQNRQYRSILSFNTASMASLPSNAIITSATLRIRIRGVTAGTDPFTTFGPLLVDIRSGYFGNSIGLELADFSSPPSTGSVTEQISPITYNWYGVNLSPANLKFINKWGMTQFRLRFNLPSNNNGLADYDMFYSGDAPSGYQPQLIVTYSAPSPGMLTYVNHTYGFEFDYPSQGQVTLQTETNGHIILPIVVPGTNLLQKYVDISVVPSSSTCTNPMSQGYPYPSQPVTFNGLTFNYQTGSNNTMANFYNLYAYSILKGNTCISLVFVLHSLDAGVLATPPPIYDFNTEYAVVLKIMSSFTYLSP